MQLTEISHKSQGMQKLLVSFLQEFAFILKSYRDFTAVIYKLLLYQ